MKNVNKKDAVIVLADGTYFWGKGIGASGITVGELCFNTSMTGYQEILTDPSYAGQIITFTFPHIGNVGTNDEDIEADKPYCNGLVIREDITSPANWRATKHLQDWLEESGLVGISNVDTRRLTRHIRDKGACNAAIAYVKDGEIDIDYLKSVANGHASMEGLDLAKDVTCSAPYHWQEGGWDLTSGYAKRSEFKHKVVALDFGIKKNILRCLADVGCDVTVVPAETSVEDIMSYNPDAVFLSNGPGDPNATGSYAVPTIQGLIEKDLPIFGICLGHQLMGLALGGTTEKMTLGHRGANQPVKDFTTNKVEITSQNHGFCVVESSLPDHVERSHTSLFDGILEGIRVKDKPIFAVQYHPEASPGPQDSFYLFERFVQMIEDHKAKKSAA